MKTILQTAIGTVASIALLMAPAAAATQKPATDTHARPAASKVVPNSWKAESLTGTIMSVDPQTRIVVVKDSSGVPFDMVVNRGTHIKAGDRELKLDDLSSDVNKKASIKFVPERRGDIAESIQMNG